MAPHDQGTKHMNNGENKKRKRILTLSQKEIQRSPLKKGKSPRKNVEFKSAHALVKQFQIKREIVLASCEKDTDHEVGRQSTMPIKKRTNEAERQSKMMMKKMTNEEEGQGKMSMKKMTNETEGQSKMSMKMTNESEGQSKMPMKKMTNEPAEQSKMLSLKKKMNTNEVEVQSKTIKKKNMTTNEVGGDNEVEEQSDDDMSNDKDKTLIPALSLDDFFTQYGIQVVEDDAEFEYDYDGDNINDDNSTTKKKTRGPTQLKDIHAMEGQIQILWDNGKPIGPTKAKVLKFSRFLGTLARNTSLVTLLYTSWQAVSETSRTALLTYAKSKYTIPNNGEPWVFATIAEAWKQFKKRIKQQHFKPYNSFREMLKNRPLSIPEVHFRKLIRYWNLDVNKVISSKNAENRSKQKWNHRMGPVSFELVRMELLM